MTFVINKRVGNDREHSRRFVLLALLGAVSISCSSDVTYPFPYPVTSLVATVEVSPPSATIQVGQTQQLSAVTKDASGKVLTGRAVMWSSSDSTKAVVNSSGLVTGVAAGPVTITATSEGKSASSTITVTTPPQAFRTHF